MGHEYMFDGGVMAKSLFSLGFWQRPWEAQGKIPFQEIGYFQADLFDPPKWKPSFPNIAFELMDDSDAYWGAKIVTSFTNELIKKLAEAGEYRRPEATRYVEDVLLRRRDAIGRYWLNRITPLEDLKLTAGESGIQFRDLAAERGYADARSRRFRFWFADVNGKKFTQEQIVEPGAPSEISLSGLRDILAKTKSAPIDKFRRTVVVRLFIQSNQSAGQWALPIEVFLGHTDDLRLQVLGWHHAPR